MEITFNGHACLTVRDGAGRVLVTDPYRPGAFGGRIAHAPVRVPADVVAVSHYHVDHSHVTADLSEGAGLPPVADRSGRVAGFAFDFRFTYHDRQGGTRMGMTAMYAFEVDGLRVVHLGDVGCPLTPEDAAALGPVDVLVWPVGGRFTLGPEDAPEVLATLRPRLALPVHYDNARCSLGMAPVEALLPHLAAPPVRPGVSTWSSADGLPERTEVRILEPAL
ncbi:MAG: MBL fold metallo-hydrolase [Myxococcota bacterium]